MAALQTLLLCLVLLQTWVAAVQKEEWKTATATYTMETDGSIINEGACGYGDLHKMTYGKYSAGLSSILFNRGSTCGACYELRCVDHILWCLQGSPSIILTATDFCPPNNGLSADYGGWCNFPKEHFEMSETAFACIEQCYSAFNCSVCFQLHFLYTCFRNAYFSVMVYSILHLKEFQCSSKCRIQHYIN